MTSRWNNPTGGFGYHLRAFSRRRSLWAPFIRGVTRFLHAWAPREKALLLVGPSGAHCLDLSFLRRFEGIIAVDFDPFAPTVFRWRTRSVLRAGVTLAWDSHDYLSPTKRGFELAPFRALLEQHRDAAVLFCNILGQLPLLGEDRDPEQDDSDPPEGSYERWLIELTDALKGRSWASFHDRVSGNVKPRAIDEGALVPWASSQEIVERHYPLTDDPNLSLIDHRTSALRVDQPRSRLVWEVSPGVFHLIEAMSFHAPE